ncbi:LysR family transcriptional regulator [Glutamicibacter sp. AOP12-B1-11]|uniref:LysR family transcriptional regulator n=1 Tax=Glutamicibacter sp. AOP12-B1-11 TaxID=3457725 RepID=UPI004034A956
MMLKQLEYFVALAREQHFARAAQFCRISQPALSESIRKLEDELGVPLVRRGHSFQGLTLEGESVLRWARRMLSDRDSLRQEAHALRSGIKGSLRLGVVPAAATTVVQLTDPFARVYDQVGIVLESSLRSADIVRRIKNYELDAGLIYAVPEDLVGLRVVPLYAEEHVLLSAVGMLPEDRTLAGWSAALELPLCLLDGSLRGRQVLDAALAASGMRAEPRIECDSVASLIAYVATGQWASIVPKQWLDPFGLLPGLEQTALVAPHVKAQMVLVMHCAQSLPPVPRAFLQTVTKIFPNADYATDLA